MVKKRLGWIEGSEGVVHDVERGPQSVSGLCCTVEQRPKYTVTVQTGRRSEIDHQSASGRAWVTTRMPVAQDDA
jgi:hypothetical protein